MACVSFKAKWRCCCPPCAEAVDGRGMLDRLVGRREGGVDVCRGGEAIEYI